MGAFGSIVPGRNLGQQARDEDSTGEKLPRLPDGPLDLDGGVVRLSGAGPAANPAAEQATETQDDE